MDHRLLKFCVSTCIGLLVSVPGWAKPVYLECVFDEGGAAKLTIDEEAGRVQYQVISNGNSWTYPAVFTDKTVSFKTELGVETISRVDLSVVLASGSYPMKGQCKIAPEVDRKF